MSSQHGPSINRGKLMVSALAVMALAASPAFAEEIFSIALNLSPSPAYLGAPTYDWNIPGADTTNGSLVGSVSSLWFIAPSGFSLPAATDWSGSGLNVDLSGGGTAHGRFDGGGTFKVTGDVWDFTTIPTFLFSGVLMEGTITAFEMLESGPASDQLNMQGWGGVGAIIFHPTGGYLLSSPGMSLSGDYYFDLTGAKAQQNGGGVQDFQSDIVTTAAIQPLMVQVPEPAAGLLLIAGLGLLMPRRRRA